MNKRSDPPEWSTQGYWQGRFEVGDTPWDLDAPSSVLIEALEELTGVGGSLSGKRVLSPGCGRGSDALECVRRGADVVAVDWSEIAVSALRARYAGSAASSLGSLEVIHGDLFEVLKQRVDVVCEHTFFCAIDPSMRPRYAEEIAAWVSSGGFLIGNFFIVSDTDAQRLANLSLSKEGNGPPFATSARELEQLLRPYFVTRVLRPGSQSEPSRREGIEWVGVFERR